MFIRKHLAILFFAVAVGWLAFSMVIAKLEPCTEPGIITLCYSVSALSLSLFFLSGFFAFAGTFTLIGFWLRIWFNSTEIYLDHLNISLRQGVLLSLCTLGSLGMLLLNVLTWWTGLLFLTIITVVELYFSRN
ncbi:hypothetical protein HYV58_01135 [Candidatus Peregrinibacteria bacterium]|nr:hypothetical protein [Candidatus Peregrinibacteria bacterium]